MPFPNKGENHSSGIKNEKDVVNFFNSNPANPITKSLEQKCGSTINSFKHQGGTKQKKDASYEEVENDKTGGLSIKNHKNGTFDWVNTTKGVPQDLKSEIAKFKKNNYNTPIPEKGGIRNDLDNIFSTYLDNLTSEDISKMLSKCMGTEENTDNIIINDIETKQLILIPESNLDPYCNPNHHHAFILKSFRGARTSRQIFIKSADGFELKTNLRIRLHLNNGITALLGKSIKNKSSVPCLKIQQDNVKIFIEKSFGKVFAKY